MTLPRLLLPMPTDGPIGGRVLTAPDPPAIDTVMLMLLYTLWCPKLWETGWPAWLYILTQNKKIWFKWRLIHIKIWFKWRLIHIKINCIQFCDLLVTDIKHHTCCCPWPLAASSLCQVTDNQVEVALAGAEDSGRWSSEVKAGGWSD